MAKYDAAVLQVPGIGEVRFGKKDKVVAVPIDGDGANGWTFVARDGSAIRCPTDAYPENIRRALVGHGAKQKLKDGTGDLDEAGAMFAYIEKTHAMLAGGQWAGAGGGGGFDSDLVAALVELTGKVELDVRAMLKDLTAAERDALRGEETIRQVIEARQAKRAAAVDVAGVLAKIGL